MGAFRTEILPYTVSTSKVNYTQNPRPASPQPPGGEDQDFRTAEGTAQG